MSETPIQPAMTPEQWAQIADWNPHPKDMSNSYLGDSVSDYDGYADPRHALAALCLYQQPFGFTEFHPALLRTVADSIEPWDDERAEELRHLAAKIQALLPPENAVVAQFELLRDDGDASGRDGDGALSCACLRRLIPPLGSRSYPSTVLGSASRLASSAGRP